MNFKMKLTYPTIYMVLFPGFSNSCDKCNKFYKLCGMYKHADTSSRNGDAKFDDSRIELHAHCG